MPETNVTTAITAATPITTPSSVSTERSLFAHSERSAMRMDSAMFIGTGAPGVGRRSSVFGLQPLDFGLRTVGAFKVALPTATSLPAIFYLRARPTALFRSHGDGKNRCVLGSVVQAHGRSVFPVLSKGALGIPVGAADVHVAARDHDLIRGSLGRSVGGTYTGDVRRYADITGGPVLDAGSKDTASRLAALIDQLRDRYTLGYKPATIRPEGTFCKLKLQLQPEVFRARGLKNRNVLVKTRRGYYW
jgi:hypothetical protein